MRGPGPKLFVASAVALFVELALIRWVPSTIHVVGFFANLVLIAAFLGLGIGMSRPTEPREGVWRALFRLAVLMGALAVFDVIDPAVSAGGDYAVNEITGGGIAIPMPLILVATYGAVAWATIPFGRLIAAWFDSLERIPAYSVNVAGSLAGVGLFALMATVELPPVAWFAVVIAATAALAPRVALVVPGALVLVVLGAQYYEDSTGFRDEVSWSPYYKVVTTAISPAGLDAGFITDVNGQFLLSGLDLRREATLPGADPALAADVELLKSYYRFPFQLAQAQRVLVLGAGAGNDVAAALRLGAEHVTAVEIDPAVLRLGETFHPEDPYGSQKVRIVTDDARAFLARSEESFDLILYATLDAHGLLAGSGSVRLDSFVYTEQSLRAARDRLSPHGLLTLSFGPFREDIQFRQYAMVREVFGQDPLWYVHANGHRTIVAGALDRIGDPEAPAGWQRLTQADVDSGLARYPYALRPATDDWPHLFLRERRIPLEYVWVLFGIIGLSALAVRARFGAGRPDPRFLFLGAGFLLLETKGVTEFALLVGSTWQTNVMVFSVILAVILFANLGVMTVLRRLPLAPVYVLLALSLIAGYIWPVSRWAGAPSAGAYALGVLSLGVPVFLAAIIFAHTFRTAALGSAALASNLLGAVLGGSVEYASLAVGIRALSLFALAMYAASFVAGTRARAT